MKNVLDRARAVIDTEQQALKSVGDNLDIDFLKIVNVVQKRKGKVVFTGVGKSGHIGKKVAATFSSLGITSIFVHSTEAVHGDLGMIRNEDVVFLLSNSGETKEVLSVIPSLNKIGCFKIAFTSKKNSSLAKACELTLAYSYENEADQLNLAPTTSAIIMLALGDSLGVTLSESTHFSSDDFHLYHPGGALGEKLEKK
ncbi:KpsF/GutQ family sugar-phosphate isomerase [Enterococcus faecium]|uniref:KpsF/GutQ family sugar-phosphate isomerase n=1 Tax=Enterococcus faecium TaxID=1352 RepID=UPI00032F8A58|nr:SIS domain-containing protein [Enterococcus faecium]EOG03991.1 KpsF/GutQ family sugar isomerase [Enterococcus faecium EnGen0171]EOK12287.1 KpsF/GutQ family sugar isomerase [Enterococcus faecium EnGen0372]EOM39457.1 KpsF/GutQ family sugar isomerase [Enterococcus faecium EnGen0172]MDG4589028.1 SIS domain-containing protein [Enterococcus faecium]MDT2317501.1 SIS domain-containing protein [Enterococcus faecium]